MFGVYRAALMLSTVLLTNLLFILVNIPFLLVLMTFPFAMQHSLFYVVSMIPMGPAFAAAFGVLGRYLRVEQAQPVKEFFIDYRRNFKAGILYWLISLPLGYFFFVDFIWMLTNQSLLGVIFFGVAFLVWIMLNINAFAALSRFTIGPVNMIRISFLMLLRHPLRTFMSASVVSICVALLSVWPGYTFVVVIGLFAIGVMYYQNPVLEVLERELPRD